MLRQVVDHLELRTNSTGAGSPFTQLTGHISTCNFWYLGLDSPTACSISSEVQFQQDSLVDTIHRSANSYFMGVGSLWVSLLALAHFSASLTAPAIGYLTFVLILGFVLLLASALERRTSIFSSFYQIRDKQSSVSSLRRRNRCDHYAQLDLYKRHLRGHHQHLHGGKPGPKSRRFDCTFRRLWLGLFLLLAMDAVINRSKWG